MAASIFDACAVAGKCVSSFFNTIDPTGSGIDAPGLVKHWAVTYDVQVRVFATVLETGSATIADLILVLPGHPAPAEAVMAMVEAGFLQREPGEIGPHTRISMPPGTSGNGAGGTSSPSLPPGGAPCSQHTNVVELRPSVSHSSAIGFVPEIFIVDIADCTDLSHGINGPIIYCALTGKKAYTGKSFKGRQRIVDGHLSGFDRLVVIRDAAGHMTQEQAGVAERILGLIVNGLPGYKLAHHLPNGDRGDFAEYLELRLFVAQALCLAKAAGFGFADIPVLHFVVGAEGDPEYPVFAGRRPADGTAYHLYAAGINAEATEHEGEWIVHAGSEVRSRVTRSSGSAPMTRRHEWLFSGVLAEDNGRFRLNEPLCFGSGSGAANFLIGSKGPNLSAWTKPPADDPNCLSPAA